MFCSVMLVISLNFLCGVSSELMFPDDFHFGVSSSAYQIEGAWNASDKGESICDRFMHEKNPSIDGGTGDSACNSYEYWKRDVAILKHLGVRFYRFSISWSRILPTGFSNKISKAGVVYYSNLIRELLRNGIEPMITITHFDIPQSIQDLGGWTNPLIADWFQDYARVLFRLFAPQVKLWMTINEPAQTCFYGYGKDILAPAISWAGVADYLCVKNVLLAHAKAWRLFDQKFRPLYGGKLGFVLQYFWYEPRTDSESDRDAADDATMFFGDIFLDPILSETGDYPKKLKDLIWAKSRSHGFTRSRLPELTADEIKLIKGTADFIGLNQYASSVVTKTQRIISDTEEFYFPDLGVQELVNPEWEKAAAFWFQVNPEGLRKCLNHLKRKYNNPQVIITENGYASKPGLNDYGRIKYHRNYLNEVLKAIHFDRCNVTHYSAWSIIDNFEWYSGYTIRFGLYDVDFSDPKLKRRAKKSALVYKNIIETRTIDTSFDPVVDFKRWF